MSATALHLPDLFSAASAAQMVCVGSAWLLPGSLESLGLPLCAGRLCGLHPSEYHGGVQWVALTACPAVSANTQLGVA